MNIPGYDAWRLQGPDERPDPVMVPCFACDGTGEFLNELHDPAVMCECIECDGEGIVPADAEEPDGDYEYERRKDAMTE